MIGISDVELEMRRACLEMKVGTYRDAALAVREAARNLASAEHLVAVRENEMAQACDKKKVVRNELLEYIFPEGT